MLCQALVRLNKKGNELITILDTSLGGVNNVQEIVGRTDGDPGVTSITFTRPLGILSAFILFIFLIL